MTFRVTPVGFCIAWTIAFGMLLIANCYVEASKPYLSAYVKWRNVVINAFLGSLFILLGGLAA